MWMFYKKRRMWMERINLKGKVRKFLLIIFTNLASLIKREKVIQKFGSYTLVWERLWKSI